MANIEVMQKAVDAKLEAEKQQVGERSKLAKKVEQQILREEVLSEKAVDPDVKELIVRSITDARAEQMTLTQWTKQIIENAKEMTEQQQDDVLELTAKITARQGIPASENAAVFGEGQIEAA